MNDIENFKYLESDLKKKDKELVNRAAERLAKILIIQIELKKKKKQK